MTGSGCSVSTFYPWCVVYPGTDAMRYRSDTLETSSQTIHNRVWTNQKVVKINVILELL